MMTNLFSIFDPSTPYFLSLNWISMTLVFLMLPPFVWLSAGRSHKIYLMFMLVLNEFSQLMKKSPYILIIMVSFFIFIMFNNVMGLLPYIFTASSHLVFTMGLALPAWLGLMFMGCLNNTSSVLAHLVPSGSPVILMPFMVLIEVISSLIRPGTLAVRLAANMIAGHLLIVLLSSALSSSGVIPGLILLLAEVGLMSLEVAVGFIQAYVFSVLITLYSAESIN